MDQLKKQIKTHDVICFDIFDTLLMRQLFDPEVVFDIVGAHAESRGIAIADFREVRKKAAAETTVLNPNIYEIYDCLQKITGIYDIQREQLLQLELETEKKVLVPRKSVVECLNYAAEQGKRVFLVSDMYLPEEILREILTEKGIIGYEKLYVSCDYRQLKYEGLLERVVQSVSSDNILHVGDRIEYDGYYAIKYGIDYYRVMDLAGMVHSSTWFSLTSQNNVLSLNDTLILGKVCSKVFNDPLLYDTLEIRPTIQTAYDIGYCFFAPVATQFMMWMNEALKDLDVEGILFSARDGYLFRKLYKILKDRGGASKKLPDYYFLTSRVACFSSASVTEGDIRNILAGIIDEEPEKVLQNIFLLAPQHIEVYDPEKFGSWKKYILRQKPAISQKASELKKNYDKYIETLGIESGKKYAFFDLASQGTCQHYLAEKFGLDLSGIYYWNRTIPTNEPFEDKRNGCYNSGIPEDDASFVLANYLYLEAIFTDPEIPSLRCFDENGNPVYGPEKRTEQEIKFIRETQEGIIDFFTEFVYHLWMPEIGTTKAVVDVLFRMIDPARTKVLDETWNQMNVIDDLMSGKRVPIREKGGRRRMPELYKDFDTAKRFHKKDPVKDMQILKYIQENRPEEYDTVLDKDEGWMVQYHFSPMRESLINWYPFEKEAEVLEVGGAFGELTHVLCQKCAYVTTVEREPVRAQGIMLRCRDYGNLDVYQCQIQDFQSTKKFDYVLAAGILESQDIATKNLADYAEFIMHLQSYLKPDGKLILTSENRMGIRYLCGAKDGKTGMPFDGINQYPEKDGLAGFTKQELENILHHAKILKYKFYYPLPDYKMVQAVYAEQNLPKDSVRDRVIPYYEDKDTILASELDMMDFCIQSGCLNVFANSFLVECALDGECKDIKSALLTMDRGMAAAMATIHEGDYVYKEALYPEGKEVLKRTIENTADLIKHGINVVPHGVLTENRIQMPYLQYPNLMSVLREAIHRDRDAFVGLLDQVWKDIGNSSDEVALEMNPLRTYWGEDEDWGPILESVYYDMVPMNSFYVDGQIMYYDQEFVKNNFPAKYTMFRTILYTYINIPEAEEVIPREEMLRRYGISSVMWAAFFNEESIFVSGLRKHNVFHHFHEMSQVSFADMKQNICKMASLPPVPEKENQINRLYGDIRRIQLNLLEELDRVCKSNGLSYTLMYGSMLGAVRNKGVIPWDDDIDVAMLRRDYDKLMELGQECFGGAFFLQTLKTDREAFYGGYSRLRYSDSCAMELINLGKECNSGIWIDILPLDDYNTAGMSNQVRLQVIRDHQEMIYAKVYGMDFARWKGISEEGWKNVINASETIPLEVLWERLEGLLRGQHTENIQYVAVLARYQTRDALRVFPKKWFEETKRVPFEDMMLPIPVQAERCLEVIYGPGFIDLPAENSRKPKHIAIYNTKASFHTVWKELPLECENEDGIEVPSDMKVAIFGDLQYVQWFVKMYGNKLMPKLILTNDRSQWGHIYENMVVDSPEAIGDYDHVLLIISFEQYQCNEEIFEKLDNIDYLVLI